MTSGRLKNLYWFSGSFCGVLVTAYHYVGLAAALSQALFVAGLSFLGMEAGRLLFFDRGQ